MTPRWLLSAVAVAVLASPACQAFTLGAHLYTAHLGPHGAALRAGTPGLYLRTDTGFTLGHYLNSYGRSSTYAGWTWQTDDRRFAITVGAVTGYAARRYAPLVVPSVRFEISDALAARIAFIPKPPRYGTAAGVHLGLEKEF